MITAPKQTRKINSFQDVAIPSPRDLFMRYGERLGKGSYSTDGSVSDPVILGGSVIDQMVNAQTLAVDYENSLNAK